MKLLLIYGSTDGQTEKIAGYIWQQIEKPGVEVAVYGANATPPKPEGFDGVIIGSSIRNRQFQAPVENYILSNMPALNATPSILFTVSSAAINIRAKGTNSWQLKGLNVLTGQLLKRTGWKPVLIEHIAGAVKYTRYSWAVKFGFWVMGKITGFDTDTSRDYEYTDWDAVSQFAQAVVLKIKERGTS